MFSSQCSTLRCKWWVSRFRFTLCLLSVTCSGNTLRRLMGCHISGNHLQTLTVRNGCCGVVVLANALSSKCSEMSETLGRLNSILGRESKGENVSGYLASDSAEENLGRTPELLLFQLTNTSCPDSANQTAVLNGLPGLLDSFLPSSSPLLLLGQLLLVLFLAPQTSFL